MHRAAYSPCGCKESDTTEQVTHKHTHKLYIFKVSKLTCWHSLKVIFSSVQFSRSVVSDSLRPHELQHTKPPCPSPTPGVYSNSCSSSRWCHPAISSSVVPSPPAPNPSQHRSFPMSQLFAWGGQSHMYIHTYIYIYLFIYVLVFSCFWPTQLYMK